ncbi:MAG: hypothetical protein ACTHXA_14315 [Gulosibacter sp.]|uniref:hypothetical protein n=1 Tax=Gulosibacter sp. TaxID=2817531 RepID=UPI003F904B3B
MLRFRHTVVVRLWQDAHGNNSRESLSLPWGSGPLPWGSGPLPLGAWNAKI